MRFRLVSLAVLCGLLGWGGYHLSVLRGGSSEPFSEVLAAAGSEPGFLSSTEANGENEDYRISALTVFSNVALHVKDNYVNPERIDPKEMLKAALFEIEKQVAEVLVEDKGQGRLEIRVMNHEKVVYIDDVESLWEINLKLREVFRFFEKYLPPQKDVRAIEYAAVNGALSTLDPHSVLLRPDQFSEMKTSTKGEFGGLGIVISIREGKLTIISPLDGTPASRAGLLASDVISRIGEVSTVSMQIEEAVNMLRGPENSKVTIWVERKGWPEARKYTLTRERIKIESVEAQLLESNVGYIKIKNFQQNTGKDLEDKLETLAGQAGGKLKGLVLDLRNNPGGLLEQAIRVSDKFLTSGDIVTTVGYGNKLREPKKARWSGTESELPIVVLVNNGSASASEIVAGALKNLDRAVVIGERTFGKGSVQVLYDFADNSALKLTIAQYLTPGNVSIQNIGITPDVELRNARIEGNRVSLFYQPESHRENSLEKHLDRNSEGQSGAVEADALSHITYLIDKDEPAPPEEEDASPQSKIEEEFPVRLARDLLIAVGSPSRKQMLEKGVSFLEGRDRQESRRIEEKIKALGVDWSEPSPGVDSTTGDKNATAKVEVDMRMVSGASGDRVEAGAEVKVEATVKNIGNVPVYRLRGILESEHPAFKGREFIFGKLGAGETRSWTITTKIPKEAASRSDLVKLKLESAGGVRQEEMVLPVVTKYVPHPQFAFNYVFDDSKRGDGDGVLEVGEGVDMVVFVSNTGPGDADEVTLRLKSGANEDLFLERGRADIGKIKSGETAMGRLRFKVPKKQSQGRDGLPIELTIYDSGTGEWMEDQFSLVADQKKPVTLAKTKGGVVTKKDTLLRVAAEDGSEVFATALKGTRFASTAKVGDFVRVDLAEDTFGWIAADDVRPGAKPKPGPFGKSLVYQAKRRAPSIKLDTDLGEGVVDRDMVTLSGTVMGRTLRDMYVLLNDKKVYFASGPALPERVGAADGESALSAASSAQGPAAAVQQHGAEQAPVQAKAAEWQAPNESSVTLPFKLDLPLKEGLNRVLVVARLDEKVISYRTLFVSRRVTTPQSVVAEAPLVEKKAPVKPEGPKAN